MAEYEIQVYTVPEVAQMLDWPKSLAYEALEQGKFPFPVIRLGPKKWVVPKKPVDAFLSGEQPARTLRLPWQKGGRGRPAKWKPSETINYNVPIPIDLHERFTAVCKYINSTITPPLTKGDWIRIALEEFIQRRPIKKTQE